MYLYNTTIKVDWSIHDEWLKWMKSTHIPYYMSLDVFSKHLFLRILQTDEQDGPTYALQLFVEAKSIYNRFAAKNLSEIIRQQQAVWSSKMLTFSTLMEIVD